MILKQIKTVENGCSANNFQAKFGTPFAVVGVRTEDEWLVDIDYLPLDTSELMPQNALASEVCNQLQEYLRYPDYEFDLSLHIRGTPFQQRVWQAIKAIPCGQTNSYADIAKQLHSSPRAVGGACGANNLPIVIPCHRVITKNGGLGGFMNASDGQPIKIKRWLLHHEGAYE